MQYPGLEPVLDDLLPKKAPLIVVKWSVSPLLLLWHVSLRHDANSFIRLQSKPFESGIG